MDEYLSYDGAGQADRCPIGEGGRHLIDVSSGAQYLGGETYVDVVCALCGREGSVRIDVDVRWLP